MTVIEPNKGGNAATVAEDVAVPACWQCESYRQDWPNRNRGVCATLGDRLRRMGLPIVGDVTVAQDGDPTKCGSDFRLTAAALGELAAEGKIVPYASEELWQEWMLTREQIA